MSASTETTTPAQRMRIARDDSPAPPWAGLKFKCGNPKCPGEWQLEAADKCFQVAGSSIVLTPSCSCGHRTSIDLQTEEAMHGGS